MSSNSSHLIHDRIMYVLAQVQTFAESSPWPSGFPACTSPAEPPGAEREALGRSGGHSEQSSSSCQHPVPQSWKHQVYPWWQVLSRATCCFISYRPRWPILLQDWKQTLSVQGRCCPLHFFLLQSYPLRQVSIVNLCGLGFQALRHQETKVPALGWTSGCFSSRAPVPLTHSSSLAPLPCVTSALTGALRKALLQKPTESLHEAWCSPAARGGGPRTF